MKFSGHSWQPTITLAKLFEEQNQFFDALAAYELISQSDSSPAVRERIEALHLRILNDPSNRYDPRIEKLFSPEELAYFKILNHQGFDNMATALDKMNEGLDLGDFSLEQELEEILTDTDEIDNMTKILNEIEQQAQLNLISSNADMADLTVQDLLISILTRFDRSQRLNEVKLSDLVSLFIEMQGKALPGK